MHLWVRLDGIPYVVLLLHKRTDSNPQLFRFHLSFPVEFIYGYSLFCITTETIVELTNTVIHTCHVAQPHWIKLDTSNWAATDDITPYVDNGKKPNYHQGETINKFITDRCTPLWIHTFYPGSTNGTQSYVPSPFSHGGQGVLPKWAHDHTFQETNMPE